MVASLALHAGLLGAALLLLPAPAPAPSERGLTRMLATAAEVREPLPDADEPFETAQAAPQAFAPAPDPQPDLPEITLEPKLAPVAEVPPAAAPLLQPPPTQFALAGRRVRPLVLAPQEPVPAVPAPAVPAPAVPAPAVLLPEVPAPKSATGAAPTPAPLRLLVQPDPTYPAGLRWQGEVVLRLLLWVRADGTLGDVVVERASGVPALDAHVTAFLARHWRFAPLATPRWIGQSFRIPAPR